MKIQFALALGLIAFLATAHAQNINAILQNPRIVQQEIKCLLDRAPCDPIGRKLKEILPEALNNNCEKCNPKHKELAKQLIPLMQSDYSEEWRAIINLYSKDDNKN